MADSSSQCVIADIHPTIGALEIGAFMSVFLFGVMTVQTHMYYRRFPDDKRPVKLLVALVWLLEVGHTGCVCYTIYNSTITLYGQPERLKKFKSIYVAIILGGLLTALVQIFFSLRLWRAMANRFLGIFCCTLSAARCIGSIVAAFLALAEPTLQDFAKNWDGLITTLLVVGAFVDVVIAVAMCYFLKQQREIALSKISRLIDSLIAWTIQTGLITSISAIAMVICFQTMPQKLTWLGIYTFLAKLYSNCLLASLNSRYDLRNAMGRFHEFVVPPMNSPIRSSPSQSQGPRFFHEVSVELTQSHDVSMSDATAARLFGNDFCVGYPDRPEPVKVKEELGHGNV